MLFRSRDKALLDFNGREAGRYTVTLTRSNPLTLQSVGVVGVARKTIEVRLIKSGFPPLAAALTVDKDPPASGLDTRLKTAQGLERLVEGIQRNGTDTYNPAWGTATILGAVGSPTAYRTVIINGDCEFRGAAGFGILLVRGDLTFRNNFSWNGLVLVIGQGTLRVTSGTSGWISGAVFVARTRAADRTPENLLGTLLDKLGSVTSDLPSDSVSLEFSAAEGDRANRDFPYVPISYREF